MEVYASIISFASLCAEKGILGTDTLLFMFLEVIMHRSNQWFTGFLVSFHGLYQLSGFPLSESEGVLN